MQNITFNAAGFAATMITLVIFAALLVCHRWIKKITKYYWFWLGIGLFLTIYIVVLRMVPCWQRFIDLLNKGYDPSQDYITITNALMTDLCIFFGIALPFSLVVDPTRKAARAMAPLAFGGAIFVIIGQFPTGGSGFQWGWHYLFVGAETGELYAFIHIANLFLSVGVLLNTPKFGWKGYLSFIGVLIAFYIYVIICINTTGCQMHVSGLTLQEWQPGFGYGWLAELTHWSAVACMSFGLPIIFILFSAIPYLNDHVLKRFKQYQFGNVRTDKWYVWNNPNYYVKE